MKQKSKNRAEKTGISRRQFLIHAATLSAGASLTSTSLFSQQQYGLKRTEARYYIKLPDKKIQCELCPWQCIVAEGKRGNCEVRENREGIYYSLVYGNIASHNNDPIEKKPFFHFLPGSTSFSIATAGCNVDCKFCQNWELSQRRPEDIPHVAFSPEEIVGYAKQAKCRTVAYTYNEPTISSEFIVDVAACGNEQEIRSILVSNGYINQKPLRDLCRVVSGYKVDLKAFTESYYLDVVGGRLAPVLDTLVTLKSEGIWTEIVYLVVPTLNDDEQPINEMVKWILNELGPDVPLHFSRFYPKYKLLNLPPTPIPTLEKLRNIGLDGGMHYVYLGNVPGHAGENTVCPKCQKTVVGRVGYQIIENHIVNGRCRFCNYPIPGVWE